MMATSSLNPPKPIAVTLADTAHSRAELTDGVIFCELLASTDRATQSFSKIFSRDSRGPSFVCFATTASGWSTSPVQDLQCTPKSDKDPCAEQIKNLPSAALELGRPTPSEWALKSALGLLETLTQNGLRPDRITSEADGGVALYYFKPYFTAKVLLDNDEDAIYAIYPVSGSSGDSDVIEDFDPSDDASVQQVIAALRTLS